VFFKGDLNKFYQPDLIMFLANLGKEGVLTVTQDDLNLNISIKEGVVTGAYSEGADGKILRSLLSRGLITEEQMAAISQMKRETGMQAVDILEKLKLLEKKQILPELQMAVREVLLRFFLMEAGKFQFLNVVVEANKQGIPCQAIVLELARQVDEWREMERHGAAMDQVVMSRVPEKSLEKVPHPARYILETAKGCSVAEIVEQAPISSFKAYKLVSQMLAKKLLVAKTPGTESVAAKEKLSPQEALLQSFKKSYGHILEPREGESKVDRLVSFCKYYFDQTAVFTVRDERVVRCVSHVKDASGKMVDTDKQGLDVDVNEGPILSGVNRSGVAFFGRLDFSEMMGKLLDLPPSGECALILVERTAEESRFLFALSNKEPGYAFQYLKFFSEMMESKEKGEGTLVSVSERATKLVAEVDDIPPMSQVVTRVLQLLSDPEKSIKDLATVLSEDQAMVARIIRVSNSALYRSLQEVRNLNQALSRLGLKTIRSILLTSATKDLLISDKSAGGMWSRVLWQHAKETAVASRRIAEHVKYPDPEEAFVGGMLHDMGKLVILLKHRNLFQQVRKLQSGENLGSDEAERFVLGFSHPEIGGLLMEKWHMPEALKHCIQNHHQPASAGDDGALTRIVAYGNVISNLNGMNETAGVEKYQRDLLGIRKLLNIGDADALEAQVVEDLKQADVFE